MIPNGTRVRIKPTDPVLKHVHGLEGVVVSSYHLPTLFETRRYIVCVNGLDYDLTYAELEVV